MEIFLLGVVVGVVGAKGKRILKPLARGYLELADRAREFGAELRENFEDALAEARYEREQEAAGEGRGEEEEPDARIGVADQVSGGSDDAAADGARPAAAARSTR